jgi:hypothetical protein
MVMVFSLIKNDKILGIFYENAYFFNAFRRPHRQSTPMVCRGGVLQHAEHAPLNVYATSRAPLQLEALGECHSRIKLHNFCTSAEWRFSHYFKIHVQPF